MKTSSKPEPLCYLAQCSAFGYELTVVSKTAEGALVSLVNQVVTACRHRDGTPESILGRSADAFVRDYTGTVAQPMERDVVQWL